MTLDITVDAETETVHATLDGSIYLYARRDCEGNIFLSKSFDELTDDDIFDAMRTILVKLIKVAT